MKKFIVKNSPLWQTKDVKEIIKAFKSDAKTGLREEEAKSRVDEYGSNELVRIAKTPWYKVFLRQFTDVLILILFAAAAISLAIGEGNLAVGKVCPGRERSC